MLIRTWNRGSKNKDGHNAGGARLGAGRKRQDGTMSDQAAILSAVRALKRASAHSRLERSFFTNGFPCTELTGEDLVGALTITTENGTKISVDLAIKEPVVKLENGDIDIAAPGETGASNVRAGAIIDDDDDEGAEADGLIVNGEVVVERVPAAVQQPLPADVKGKAREALCVRFDPGYTVEADLGTALTLRCSLRQLDRRRPLLYRGRSLRRQRSLRRAPYRWMVLPDLLPPVRSRLASPNLPNTWRRTPSIQRS